MKAEWFKDRLRELREQADLSRSQLAERAGLRPNGIRDLEQGINKPSWETVIALCQALNVKPDVFTEQPADLPPLKAGRPRKASVDADSAKGKPTKKAARKQKGK
jgi:transcriptional regulator with XRE-family HTH domain